MHSIKNTKLKGNLGEAQALATLVKLGIPVYLQFGDNEPADYLIIVNKHVFKIQVKASSSIKNGKIVFPLSTSQLHRGKSKKIYSKDEVDAFICYDIPNDSLYVIKNSGKNATITFRLEKPKNHQTSNIHLASDFIFNFENLQKALS